MKKGRRSGSKFQPLSPVDIEKDQILISGRHPCTCEASRHGLISNCLSCGRIVCEQEGSGPCFTCGELVCTPKEQEVISRESKTSMKLYAKLMNLDYDNRKLPPKSVEDGQLQKALDHRNKLLEYDRTVEKRTRVIDDENDYFQADKWSSEKERKLLSGKEEEINDALFNRRNQKYKIDFAGRRIVEEVPKIEIDVEELLKTDDSIFECKDVSTSDIPVDIRPVYDEPNDRSDYYVPPPEKEDNKRLLIRIQDKELQEMSDEGHCLSVHQPYASLIVAGIKKHEGRVWYTSYRGRLWIHSAAKEASKLEIAEVENLYKNIQANCDFPKRYPPSCLVGCVDLVDCLPQEEYKTQFPHGEIASSYAFICENPQELSIQFPMNGKHKIFTLDSRLHQVAKKALSKLKK